ncbi:glycosyltransferase family 2 protein [Oryzihumus sp.]|uniref:glycosyltransferase family 2 protein n=1 Tax=Oryzihumus sp. TaxID=1968903 RepID=UPI002ED9E978
MVEPLLVGDLDLDAPLPHLPASPRHARSRLLARLHTRPMGEVDLRWDGPTLAPDDLAVQTWPQVADRVREHLRSEGASVPDALPVHGLAPDHPPVCLEVRSRPEQPSITVVVATRDRTVSLERTLKSLERLRYQRFDVVVVDSAPSTDETREALQTRSSPFALRYVRTSRPGLALAHNAALDLVTGEVVAFTDDDVEVDPWWLSAVAETFADADVTCVTGLILPAELETPAQLWVEQAGGFARGFDARRFSLAHPSPDPLFPFTAGRFGSGANMSFRTRWLRDRAGFDRATGAGTPARGGDDLAAFCRVVLDGGVLAYQPSAIVRHWHRRDYAGLRRQSLGYGIGLGAYLTATAWRQPSLIAQMARRAVPATAHLLSHDSAKNQGKRSDFPTELTWRERAGVALGPPAYVLSRWRYRSTAPWGATP